MRRMAAAVVLMAGTAQAAEPAPICGDAGVLQRVDELLRAQGRPAVLEPPAGEVSRSVPGAALLSASPPSPPLAHCAVRGHTVGYDTNRYGMTPVHEPFIVNYTIELRRNGLFVSIP